MEQLGIDIKQIIAQLINFVLFFLIFKKFIATPFSRFLNQEKNKEKSMEEMTLKLKTEEGALAQRREKMVEEIRIQQEKILKETKHEADKLKKQILLEARKEAEEILKKGRIQLEEDGERLNRSVKERMVDLSVSLVNRAFKDYLDEEAKKRITKYILENLTKDVSYYEN